MRPKLFRPFIYTAGVLLLVTALAKLVSSQGDARILQSYDPILRIKFQQVFWVVGVVELIIAIICFLPVSFGWRTKLVAWLATNFVIYRVGLWLIGYQRPCPCLGNLTDALPISPSTADLALKILLGYLLVGSYALLFWVWRQGRSIPS
jgi:uncharacterized membrane protein